MNLFVRVYPPARPEPGPVYWLPLHGDKDEFIIAEAGEEQGCLLYDEPARLEITLNSLQPPLFLGRLDGIPVLASRVNPEVALQPGLQALGLRQLFGRLPEWSYGLAGYAYQMLGWQKTSIFCPACATPVEDMAGDWGRRCPKCGLVRYPPVSPAVLILIHDGNDRILLTHKKGWGKMYSIIAGFVEPGETVEECLLREAEEEAGLKLIGQPVYFGSQPWPFPHQLMLGFMVESEGGEIRLDEQELDDAGWYDVHDLPELPSSLSLSRQLIDYWIESRKENKVFKTPEF